MKSCNTNTRQIQFTVFMPVKYDSNLQFDFPLLLVKNK